MPQKLGSGERARQKEVRHVHILTLLLLGEEPRRVKHHRQENNQGQETRGASRTTQKLCTERRTSLPGSLDADTSDVSPGRWGKKQNPQDSLQGGGQHRQCDLASILGHLLTGVKTPHSQCRRPWFRSLVGVLRSPRVRSAAKK